MTQFEVATAAGFVALAAARVSGGGDRGRAGRQARRDQRDPLAGHGADLGRARPHRVAGRDRGSRSRPRSWPCCATTRRWSPATRQRRDRGARRRGSGGARRRLTFGRRWIPGRTSSCAPRGRFSAATSRSRPPPPRRSWASVDAARCAQVAAELMIPGRLELVSEDPPTFLDAAHNPDGAAALAEALPEVSGGRPVFACLAILADKDAEAMMRGAGAGARARGLHRAAGGPPAGAAAAPARARVRPPSWPRSASGRAGGRERRGAGRGAGTCPRARAEAEGVALAAGSHYLLGAAWTRRHAQSFSR